MKRRHAVHTRIEDAFRLEWRDLETLVAERREQLGVSGDDAVAIDDEEENDDLFAALPAREDDAA